MIRPGAMARALAGIVSAVLLFGAGSAAAAEDEPVRAWAFSAYLAGYRIPDDEDFLLPTFRADRGRLHLEARSNYEALDSGSVWIGCNVSFGQKVTLDLTPMVGAVFGDLKGWAPGYEATLAWKELELYTEGEIVFDRSEDPENFFYSWSEVSFAPVDRFRFGVVIQRTRAYETDFDIQRGVLAGVAFERGDVTAYVLNPDEDPTLVLAGTVEF